MITQGWFSLAGNLVLLGWLLLVVALCLRDGAIWRTRLMALGGLWIPAVLSAGWATLFLALTLRGSSGDLFTLEGVATKFASRDHLFLLYLEVLTFSLFIARWVIEDAVRRGVPRGIVAVAMPLQFLFGPLGLLTYLGIRGRDRKGVAT